MAAFGNQAEVPEVLWIIRIGWVYLSHERVWRVADGIHTSELELSQEGGDTQFGGCGYRKTDKTMAFDLSQQFETVTC